MLDQLHVCHLSLQLHKTEVSTEHITHRIARLTVITAHFHRYIENRVFDYTRLSTFSLNQIIWTKYIITDLSWLTDEQLTMEIENVERRILTLQQIVALTELRQILRYTMEEQHIQQITQGTQEMTIEDELNTENPEGEPHIIEPHIISV